MITQLQKRFALSRQGAQNLIKGCAAQVLFNLALMIPVGLVYYFVCTLLDGSLTQGESAAYIAGCVGCLVLIFGCGWLQYDCTYLATYKESGVRRTSLAERLRQIPLSFFGHRDLADLTSSIMSDCASLETVFSHYVPALAGAVVSSVLIAAALFFVDWRMALASVWVLPVAFAIVGFSSRVQDALSQRQREASVGLEESISEFIGTLRDLQSNNAEERYLHKVTPKIQEVERSKWRSEVGTAVYVVSAGLILKLGVATVALTGAVLFTQEDLSLPLLFMFLLVASRLYEPLEGALQNLAAVISTNANVDRLIDIESVPLQTGSPQISNRGYDLAFEDVGFAYENDKGNVLRDVSFTARQGEVTALVGPSGSGKTTIARLAARFWDPEKGRITLGGADISKADPEALLSMYSIVFQDVTLFNDTILENIRLGRRDATDEEVLEAARLANCDTFVQNLPDGYQTQIGENGCRLSGGERQRISIARAILKDAPVILLDEATAALDVENETEIQQALSRLIRDKTVLVVAHRLRTVTGASKIVVLADGTVKETGMPEQLMKTDSLFRHMIDVQNDVEDWTL